jgi:hypothetical protein
MNLAKSIGIDAFALDIGKPRRIPSQLKLNCLPYSGKDSYNDQQLGFAYAECGLQSLHRVLDIFMYDAIVLTSTIEYLISRT